jgi:hypothetical protein
MSTLFLYHIFPHSVPMVQYNFTMTMNKSLRSVSLDSNLLSDEGNGLQAEYLQTQ